MLAGGVLCVAAAVWLTVSLLLGTGRAISPGPVTSGHSNFEATCSACHEGFREASADACLACHGRVGEGPGELGFAAHYEYRGPVPGSALASDEAGEATGSGDDLRAGRDAGDQVSCAVCHRDHRGRDAMITAVPDALCTSCHPFGSFDQGHPELAFARHGIPDDPNLAFTHRLHVAEVSKRLGFQDRRRACLECHEPDDRGAGFRPVDFDRHCDACHLTESTGTPRLPMGGPSDPDAPGVLTLEDFRSEWGPEARWTAFTNPDDFRRMGGYVTRRPVYHEDPWILANLRRIRATLHPDLGLGDLLSTGVDGGTVLAEEGELYEEAIGTLRERLAVLRGLPSREVGEEIRRLEEVLVLAEERLMSGEGTDSIAPFLPTSRSTELSADHAERLERLALELTTPCRRCHVVTDAAIQRVQKDQRTLVRAEFDHRAHLVQRPDCLSCHGAIPRILDGEPKGEDDPTDVAATQNLPTVATCRECHTREQAASTCVSCHRFHPGDSRHAGLRFLRTVGGG